MIWIIVTLVLIAVPLSFVAGACWERRSALRTATAEETFARDVEGRLAGSDVNHYKSTAPRAVVQTPQWERSHLWSQGNNGDS